MYRAAAMVGSCDTVNDCGELACVYGRTVMINGPVCIVVQIDVVAVNGVVIDFWNSSFAFFLQDLDGIVRHKPSASVVVAEPVKIVPQVQLLRDD